MVYLINEKKDAWEKMMWYIEKGDLQNAIDLSKMFGLHIHTQRPLYYACRFNHPHIVEYITSSYDCSIDGDILCPGRPIETACSFGSVDVVRLLLKKGVKISNGFSHPIFWCNYDNRLEITKLLMDAKPKSFYTLPKEGYGRFREDVLSYIQGYVLLNPRRIMMVMI